MINDTILMLHISNELNNYKVYLHNSVHVCDDNVFLNRPIELYEVKICNLEAKIRKSCGH